MHKLISTILLSCSVTAFSYDFWQPQGKSIRWNKETIEFKVSPELGAEAREAFIDSANKWSEALNGKIKFVESDNPDIYVYERNFTPEEQNGRSCLGLAELTSIKDNEILSAKIALNSDFKFSRIKSDKVFSFDDLLTHELGHCLGLGHPNMNKVKYLYNPNKGDLPTMYGGQTPFGEQSSLHLDDIAGIKALYGQEEPPIYQIEQLDIIAQKVRKNKYSIYVSEEYSDNELTMKIDGVEYPKKDWYKLRRGLHKIETELKQGYWLEGKPLKRTGTLYLQVGKLKRKNNNCFQE